MFERDAILVVDFNDIDAEHRVTAYLADENAGAKVQPGQEVLLHDLEGNSVKGLVTVVEAADVIIEPAWGTWRERDSLRMVRRPMSVEEELYFALVSKAGQFKAGRELVGK